MSLSLSLIQTPSEENILFIKSSPTNTSPNFEIYFLRKFLHLHQSVTDGLFESPITEEVPYSSISPPPVDLEKSKRYLHIYPF